MINFAASININKTEKNVEQNLIYPVESLYSQIMNNNQTISTDKLDKNINDILKR